MVVLQSVPAYVRVLRKTQENSIRFHILDQVVCYPDVRGQRGRIGAAPDPKDACILNLAVLNDDALCSRKRYCMILRMKHAELLELDVRGVIDLDRRSAGISVGTIHL